MRRRWSAADLLSLSSVDSFSHRSLWRIRTTATQACLSIGDLSSALHVRPTISDSIGVHALLLHAISLSQLVNLDAILNVQEFTHIYIYIHTYIYIYIYIYTTYIYHHHHHHHTVQVTICASGTRKKTTSASYRG